MGFELIRKEILLGLFIVRYAFIVHSIYKFSGFKLVSPSINSLVVSYLTYGEEPVVLPLLPVLEAMVNSGGWEMVNKRRQGFLAATCMVMVSFPRHGSETFLKSSGVMLSVGG